MCGKWGGKHIPLVSASQYESGFFDSPRGNEARPCNRWGEIYNCSLGMIHPTTASVRGTCRR